MEAIENCKLQIANCELNATTGEPAANRPNPRSQFSIFNFQISIFNFRRRGMTLIELLVVLVIILLLAAATIPKIRPDIDRSRIRESARSLQLYLSTARNQALFTGRPCGVIIESAAHGNRLLDDGQPGRVAAALLRRFAFLAGHRIGHGCFADHRHGEHQLQSGHQYHPGFIKAGDQIQFGLQGPVYTITTPTTATSGTLNQAGAVGPLDMPVPRPFPTRFSAGPVKSAAPAVAVPLAGGDRSDVLRADTANPTFWGAGEDTRSSSCSRRTDRSTGSITRAA